MRARPVSRRSALALALGVLALAACNRGGADAADGPMTLGREDAPVTVTEFASVACPACAAWDAQVWPEFKRKYVDTGLVKFEYREMLTGQSQVAAAGFLIARCAGRDKYFDVVHALYRGQEEMARTGDVRGVLLRIAQSAGLTEEQFEACISDEDALVALNERNEANARIATRGTPTFLVNGEPLENATMAGFDAAIQPLLRQRGGG